jgi:hypothetical protein
VELSAGTTNNQLVVADGYQTVVGGGLTATAYDAVTGRQSWQTDSGVGTIAWVGDGLYGAGHGSVSRLS